MDKKLYTFKDLMKLFKRSKYITRLYIDRFAVLKEKGCINGHSRVFYRLDEGKIKEIKRFIEYLEVVNERRKNENRNRKTSK